MKGQEEEEEEEEASQTPTEQEQEQQSQQQWGPQAWSILTAVRDQSPLIQCITNFVSMDLMANTLLAAGASPAMLHCFQEIPDFTPHVQALCINIGTLSPEWLPAMKSAATLAIQVGKPWVLDPVAVFASEFRLSSCLELMGLKPCVVRGNASEILALSNASKGPGKGVDSSLESTAAVDAAKSLARATGAVIAVSGAVDIITDGHRVASVHNGVAMMQKITATGCAVTALISAFIAVNPFHAFEATASALSVFGVAGEMGMDLAKGPASLRMHLIDALYGLDQASLLSRVKITNVE